MIFFKGFTKTVSLKGFHLGQLKGLLLCTQLMMIPLQYGQHTLYHNSDHPHYSSCLQSRFDTIS